MAEENEILEEGTLYFFFRPAVEDEDPEGLEDVQRFYLIMNPDDDGYRVLVVGRKRLPDPEEHERNWGFVEMVADKAEDIRDFLGAEEYETKTRGRRRQPAARPAGEGHYAVFSDGHDTRLSYALELPEKPAEVQRELDIEEEATYVLSIKNPDASSPAYAGLSNERRAEFPHRLRERFGGRRWIAADPPDFLNYTGAEFLLIGAHEEVAEAANRDVQPGRKRKKSQIFRKLHMRKSEMPVKPLFEGKWD